MGKLGTLGIVAAVVGLVGVHTSDRPVEEQLLC
jgi:hypothetical protein